MALREDGMETRRRLLEAACEVFAEKGYRAATIADICRRAKANVAAVNYYFGDKETLYKEAWEHSFCKCAVTEPPDPNQGAPEDLLQDYIHTLIENFAEKSSRGYFTRLYLMEMANPTGLVKEKWKKLIEPRRQKFLKLIQTIMKKQGVDEDVIFCEMSIMSQCRALLTVSPTDIVHLLGRPLSPEVIHRLANHITRFSLAGIRAIAQKG